MDDALSLDAVRDAARRIAGAVSVTPCRTAPRLAAALGIRTWIKLEQLQFTGSFKERGALNALLQLSFEERARGVIAASAGNHGLGLAYHARRLAVGATIVMPKATPNVKVRKAREFGARVVLEGDSYDEAALHARALEVVSGAVFVHPYDDAAVMAGGGTIALEMLAQAPQIDALVVQAGGGGLIAGMACAAKALRPDIRVYGVRSEGGAIADGIAVRALGDRAFSQARNAVDAWISVGERTIVAAMHRLMETEKVVAEGAGATGLAGVVARPDLFRDRTVGIVVTGGNVDARTYAGAIAGVDEERAC